MGIPSSSYFDQNQRGKQLPTGWNTCKVTGLKVKDLVSRKDQQLYPCLILDLVNTDGVEHTVWLKTDDTSNFDWANFSRLFELEWTDGVEMEAIQDLFENNVVGNPFDVFVTHSKPNADGKIFVNIKEYAPVGTGGGEEEQEVVTTTAVKEAPPSSNGKAKRKF